MAKAKKIGNHYDGNRIYVSAGGEPGKRVAYTLVLKAGETAWMPASTKHWFRGPCVLKYTFQPDGGTDCERTGGSMVPSDTPGA